MADFGSHFEDENNGSASVPTVVVTPAPAVSTGAAPISRGQGEEAGVFRGTLVITTDGKRVLLNAGGVKVEVLATPISPTTESALVHARRDTMLQYQDRKGQEVILRGVQVDSFILLAQLAESRVPARVTVDKKDQSDFTRIQEAIAARRDAIKQELPEALALRPGYQTEPAPDSSDLRADVFTQPALVVEVHPSRLRADGPEKLVKMVSAALGKGYADVTVEVAPAPVATQARALEGGTESTDLSSMTKFARARMVFPLWEEMGAVESATRSETEEVTRISYQPPTHVVLDRVTGPMVVTCHVSPDAGWPTLSRFLAQTTDRLTIGMYDFTAPHIVQAVRGAMSGASGSLKLILQNGEALPRPNEVDSPKANDLKETVVRARLKESLGNRFSFVTASVSGPNQVFANSYHIKVAVRDGRSFWLSSGNWQSSNQPNLNPLFEDSAVPEIHANYNREWHVVVDHPGMAEMYEKFLEWDMRLSREAGNAESGAFEPDVIVPLVLETTEAEERTEFTPRFFPPQRFVYTAQSPLTVQPLLTPDNFIEQILPLLRGAKRSILFQNQSLKPLQQNDPAFAELLEALQEKLADKDMDVRIILRDLNAGQMLEALHSLKFDTRKIRIQKGCHTKGILIDGKVCVLGSHNWTNSGTQWNRDASLIFFDSRITQYYTDIFEWDWTNLARPYRRRAEIASAPVLVSPATGTNETAFAEESPSRYMRMPLSAYLEEDE